jgi:hypothetical protein
MKKVETPMTDPEDALLSTEEEVWLREWLARRVHPIGMIAAAAPKLLATLDAERLETKQAYRLAKQISDARAIIVSERDSALAELAATRLLLEEESGLRKSLGENMAVAHKQLANESREYATVVRARDAALEEAKLRRDALYAYQVAASDACELVRDEYAFDSEGYNAADGCADAVYRTTGGPPPIRKNVPPNDPKILAWCRTRQMSDPRRGDSFLITLRDEDACAEEEGGWMCTRPKGHAGDHIATCDAEDGHRASIEKRWAP